MNLQFGNREFTAESRYLTLNLRDSTAYCDNTNELRSRFEEDGYLLIRGFHDSSEVMSARRDMLQVLGNEGKLDPDRPFEEGVIHPGQQGESTTVRGRESLKTESLKRVVYGPRAMRFFDRFFDEPSLSLKFQWLRAAGRRAGSGIHCDTVYMGRGSQQLVTLWTPFGHITPEMGPIVVCLGSSHWQHVIESYGRDDVDRDNTSGVFSNDPAELVDKFGGRWATTTFEPGDVLILSIHLMHASLTNTTDRYRISCDTRYQPASHPVDERWGGAQPLGHPVMWRPNAELEPLDTSRRRWGLWEQV
jgi:hypothetical protein